jgi:P27 family predicted phage terminase small subunit
VPAIPEPPDGLLVATQTAWAEFWGSDLARVIDPVTDGHAVRRVFTLYDERDRAYREFRKERLVKGSQGQKVLNPLGRLMHELDAEIRQMEDRLGMNPRSRLQIGITFGQAAKSLQDLNRNLENDNDNSGGTVIDVDPRTTTA